MNSNPLVISFYDEATGTVSHVVYDEVGGSAALVDSVLNYDSKSGRTSTFSADQLIACVHEHDLTVEWILETHAHADHLSAAQYLKQKLGGRVAIGQPICQVQTTFKKIFNLGENFPQDGSQFDHLFVDEELFSIGALTGRALSVPGHTPADVAYQIGDIIFVGDTLFMPDVGTARCDFPGGDAYQLYSSIRKLLSFPKETRLFMCHDYPHSGRPVSYQTNVAEQKMSNIHVRDGVSEAEFVAMRQKRDASLDMPNLLLPSIQINIRAGLEPLPEENGVSYLKIPINAL